MSNDISYLKKVLGKDENQNMILNNFNEIQNLLNANVFHSKQYVEKCDGKWTEWSPCDQKKQYRKFVVKRVGNQDNMCAFGSGEIQERTC